MTDCGCLGNARALQRELAGPSPVLAELARMRAAHPIDDAEARRLFGVGLDTLERIESGEVAPEADVAERIGRFFHSHSDAPPRRAPGPACPPDRLRDTLLSPAAATAGVGGAAASPHEAAAPIRRVARMAPALAKGDGGGFHVELYFGDTIVEQPIEVAEQMANEILALVAVARDPLMYGRQPRLARPASEES